MLADGGHAEIPNSIATTNDPFDVLRYADTLGKHEARYVENAFTAHEIEAITRASTTPGSHDLIRIWHQSGRPLAIVSNNSIATIRSYLELYNLTPYIDFISGRFMADPSLPKPSPYLLNTAMTKLGVTPDGCVLLGDSISDIIAARAAGVEPIAYVNKYGKDALFAAEGAATVVTSIYALT